MVPTIAAETIEEIRQRTDLVALAGEYLALERRGKNMVGLCPFHDEKTPSFNISPDKQLYHCFGCGASGNVFHLFMALENVPFPEAARLLAARAGLELPTGEGAPGRREEEGEKTYLYRLNSLASRFFNYCLLHSSAGEKARAYLTGRGLEEKVLAAYQVGYAPPGWTTFVDFSRRKNLEVAQLLKGGLALTTRDGRVVDRFRDRIIFPITTAGGEIAGFGGRALSEGDKSGPKYLNSPQSSVFDKGRLLYGLNRARESIRREGRALVMEGYTDVLTAAQAGITNAVATLGTALTAAQARLLRSQAREAIIAYDADSAGEAAAWRGLVVLQGSGCQVQVAEMPSGRDPDSYIREHGAQAFRELINGARPLYEYHLDGLRARHDPSTVQGRGAFVNELGNILVTTGDYVERGYYLRLAAESIGVSEEALRTELRKRRGALRRQDMPGDDRNSQGEEGAAIRPAENIFMSLTLQGKEYADKGRSLIKPEHLQDERVSRIVRGAWEMAAGDGPYSAEKLLTRLGDEGLASLISRAVTEPEMQELSPPTAKQMLEDCAVRLRRDWFNARKREMERRLKDLENRGAGAEVAALLREHQELLGRGETGTGKGGDDHG